jgi:ethanolamine transporter
VINATVAPVYAWFHADPSLAAGTFIAGDMGGYMLAHELAGSHGAWIMAFIASFTAGSTIVFSVPVGLAMTERRDHKYLALGVMSGLLAIPFAVFVATLLIMSSGVLTRDEVSTSGKGTTAFDLPMGEVLLNILPLALVMLGIALALRFFTQATIKVFLAFGRGLEMVLTAALALAIVEYFTNIFSTVFGSWPLAPFIADAEDQFRALEVAGYIGVMLAGAFPMVYAIRKGLAKPLGAFGQRFGISQEGMSGFLAATANILALFRIIRVMPPKEKVLTIAYSVCAAFLIGDHLAFTANFQPALIAAVMGGKFFGGILAIVFAVWLVLPQARRLEAEDRRTGVIEAGEYLIAEPASEPVQGEKAAVSA